MGYGLTASTHPTAYIRIIGAEVKGFMNSKIRYTDEPLGRLRVVEDFLPAPEDLVFKEDTVKITLSLS